MEAKNLTVTSHILPVTPTAAASGSEVTGLREKVDALSQENLRLKTEIKNLKKRVASAASASASASPAKKARTPSQKKKLFQKWSNALVRESRKHKVFYDMCAPDAFQVTVKDTGIWSPEEFRDLFDGHGEKIQPTPDNNPRSVVTILRFDKYAQIKSFFEDVGGAEIDETGYEVQLWRRTRDYYTNAFRSVQYDTAESRVHEMEVHYNKARHTVQLVFSLVYGGLFEPWANSDEE